MSSGRYNGNPTPFEGQHSTNPTQVRLLQGRPSPKRPGRWRRAGGYSSYGTQAQGAGAGRV